MNPHYAVVAARAKHRCEYCRAPEVIFNFPFEVEHITPLFLHGSDLESNLALACRACNLHKSCHVSGLDSATESEVRLFNPRQDAWEKHFKVNIDSGEVDGLTGIGRATVAQLKMNRASQVAARKQWMLLELFP